MANSWQQPVAGEPSCGTLHLCPFTQVLSTDPADTSIHALDLSAVVPVGTKAVFIEARIASATTAGRNLLLYAADGTTPQWLVRNPIVSASNWPGHGVAYLDASRNMYWQASSTDVSSVVIAVMGYFI